MGCGQGTIQADGLLGTRQKAERRDPLRTRATAERGLGAALKNAELQKHFRQLEELPDDDLKMFVKLIGAYLRDHKAKQAYSG